MYTQFFGNYLLSNGYVTKEQLFSAMQRQADNHLKLGTLAIHAGYMNASEVDDTVIHQTHQDRKFGELAVELGYMTDEQVMELLKEQKPAFLSLGQVLLDDGILSNSDFEQIMNDYRSKNGLVESDIEDSAVVRNLFRNLFVSSNVSLSRNGQMFVELLFNDFIRFIGDDFTLGGISEAKEIPVKCCVKQEIIGDYAIRTYISMEKDVAIAFASRYVKDTFNDYDEYVQASLEDFLNLQNGLFIVNVSNDSSTELTIGAPEHITGDTFSFENKAYHFPFMFPFGTVNIYIEAVKIDE